MPQLLNLATEIHFQIWEYIATPEDIQSFALVCKAIYALAEPALREHHRLRTYSHVVLSRQQRESPPGDLLESLTHNPRISLYIEELLINDWACGFVDTFPAVALHVPPLIHCKYSPARQALLLRIVKESGLSSQQIQGRTWLTQITSGDEDPILALVFLVLPRLKTLILEKVRRNCSFLATVVTSIIESPKFGSLSMLTKLILREPYPTNIHCLEWLNYIELFAGLPSLRTLEGSGLIDYLSFGRNAPRSREMKKSELIDIAFWNCQLWEEWLIELIQSMKHLRSFRYTRGYQWTSDLDLRAFQVVDVLSLWADHSLENLTLHSGGGEWTFLGSFYRLTYLKELNTDYHLMLGYWETPNDQKLQGGLPNSIETVKLCCWNMTNLEEVEEVVLGVVAIRNDEFPKFKSLELVFKCSEDGGQVGDQDRCKVGVYRGNMAAIRELKKACADVGLELKVKGHFLHRRPFTSNKAQYLTIRFANKTQDDCWPPFFRRTHSLPGEYAMAPF